MEKRKTVIAVIVLVLLIAALVLVWHFFAPHEESNSFDKEITVTVIHGDGSQKSFVIGTNEGNLRGALEQEKLIEGDEGEFGLFITSVEGEAADASAEEWWCVCDGEGNMLMDSVDGTVINDGDSFQIVLKTGYDEF